MITRYAFFAGTVKPGQEAAMRAFVDERLAPLWRKFACAEQVEVLFGMESDPAGPAIPLVLAITYADHDAMSRALDSPARYESRDLLPDFYERFFEDIHLWHYVFERNQHLD
ncbi:hypothetical protein [Anderseniella sp. Alg231-50]|uniref:hypothetical protein n=1 Tax=Anderseniella sp. Alg231-50 TaxID=1922226 RepID=UPI000D5614CA